MLNYKKTQVQPRGGETFSFSRKEKIEEFDILPSERRSIDGWLSTVIDPHEPDFIRALNNSKRRNISEVHMYIERNYAHLTPIVIYYITGALIDYEWTIEQQSEETELETKRDIFLDVLIEQLAGRFYRESQWLTKIIHIPIYYLFSLLDSHLKGYLNLQDLLRYCSSEKIVKPGSEEYSLVMKKLKANLGRGDGRMYLQNLIEIQQRADMVLFNEKLPLSGSQIYQQIRGQLYQRSLQLMRQQMQKTTLEEKQSKKLKENIQLKQEDINIKDVTRILLSKKIPQSKNQLQSPKPSNNPQISPKSQSQNTINLAITPKKSTKMNVSKLNLDKSKELSYIDKLSSNYKQVIEDSQHRQILLQSKKNNLLVRESILSELQAIRLMKIRNNSGKMEYL